MVSLDVHLVFNQVPEVNMKTDLERWAEDFQREGIKYAGFISCSCNTAYQMAHETTIFPINHEFSQALQRVVEKLT